MTLAFVNLAADRVEPGPLMRLPDGSVQQVTRLYMEGACVCTLMVTFPPGSPEADKAVAARTLDGMSPRLSAAMLAGQRTGEDLDPPAPASWGDLMRALP